MKRQLFRAAILLALMMSGCTTESAPVAALDAAQEESSDEATLSHDVLAKGGGKPVASVSGSWVIAGTRVMSFSARLHEDGTASGTWQRVHVPGGPNRGEVVCMTVVGNEAWIGTRATTGPWAGFLGGFKVIDNGKGRKGGPDQVSLHYINLGVDGANAYCSTQIPGPALYDVGAGAVNLRQ